MSIKEEMTNLKEIVIKMADAVVLNMSEAINFYLNKGTTITNINDDLIDQYERLIEEICLNILLKERPFAKDLKEVTGVLKLVSDIERLGDHAEDIFEFSQKLRNFKNEKNDDIVELCDYVLKMVKDSINSFIHDDINLANEIILADEYVDKKYIEIIENLTKTNKNDQNYLHFLIYTTLVVKYLERIADHAVNVAEWCVYMRSGFYKDRNLF